MANMKHALARAGYSALAHLGGHAGGGGHSSKHRRKKSKKRRAAKKRRTKGRKKSAPHHKKRRRKGGKLRGKAKAAFLARMKRGRAKRRGRRT